jgi:hypothetical protein
MWILRDSFYPFVAYVTSLDIYIYLPKELLSTDPVKMTPAKLEAEDHQRDAAFNKTLHGKSASARGGLSALRNKDAMAHRAAFEEYFKHFENKAAADETEEIREVSSSTTTFCPLSDLIIIAEPPSRICYLDKTVSFTTLNLRLSSVQCQSRPVGQLPPNT